MHRASGDELSICGRSRSVRNLWDDIRVMDAGDQGVQRWPERPVSFVMVVMAAKPSGGSGATL